ncbi:MAG: hypothetical protein ACOVMM_09740 [Chitinophagaceae bacterium]
MKKIIVTILLAISIGKSFGQSRFTIAKYNKKDVPAVIGEIPFNENTTKDAFVDFFEKKGYKGKSNKGFVIFSGVVLNELSSEPLDVYIMTERKSRQEKDKAIVTMLLSKSYENFVSDTSDNKIINEAKTFLNSMVEKVAEYDLELQIAEQEKITNKASSKLTDLVEDGQKLAKRKIEIETQIVQNTNQQAAQKIEQEKQTQILNNLKSKRKGATTPKPTQ